MTLEKHPTQPSTSSLTEAAWPRLDEQSGVWLTQPDPIFPLRDAHYCLELALDAIREGGPATSADVMRQVLWGESKIAEFFRTVGRKPHAAAVRAAWGEKRGR